MNKQCYILNGSKEKFAATVELNINSISDKEYEILFKATLPDRIYDYRAIINSDERKVLESGFNQSRSKTYSYPMEFVDDDECSYSDDINTYFRNNKLNNTTIFYKVEDSDKIDYSNILDIKDRYDASNNRIIDIKYSKSKKGEGKDGHIYEDSIDLYIINGAVEIRDINYYLIEGKFIKKITGSKLSQGNPSDYSYFDISILDDGFIDDIKSDTDSYVQMVNEFEKSRSYIYYDENHIINGLVLIQYGWSIELRFNVFKNNKPLLKTYKFSKTNTKGNITASIDYFNDSDIGFLNWKVTSFNKREHTTLSLSYIKLFTTSESYISRKVIDDNESTPSIYRSNSKFIDEHDIPSLKEFIKNIKKYALYIDNDIICMNLLSNRSTLIDGSMYEFPLPGDPDLYDYMVMIANKLKSLN